MQSLARSPADVPSIFTRERLSTFALGGATLLALYLSSRLLQPFAGPISFALAIAIAADGPYRRFSKRLRNSTWSAALAVMLVASLILIPLSLLGAYTFNRVIAVLDAWRTTGLDGLMAEHPSLARAWAWIAEHFELDGQLQAMTQAGSQYASNFLGGALDVATQLVITMFVLFFLFRDRALALGAIRRLVPLTHAESTKLFGSIADTVRATVNGSLLIGLVQAVMAGIMYQMLGVGGALVWAFATFFAALIPMFGTGLIWGPITLYLILVGSWGKAAILVGWGILAIGMIDNLLYPFLVGSKLRLHTVPTFFAILGGIAAFGAAGLILGPVILAVTVGLLDVWWSRTSDGAAAEDEVPHTSNEPPIRQ